MQSTLALILKTPHPPQFANWGTFPSRGRLFSCPAIKKQPLRSHFRSSCIMLCKLFSSPPGQIVLTEGYRSIRGVSFSQRVIVQFEVYKASSLVIPADLFYNLRRCASTQNGGMRSMNKVEERKTTLNVSISADDKKFLKMYALEHDTTVAALIEAYVEKLRKEARKY